MRRKSTTHCKAICIRTSSRSHHRYIPFIGDDLSNLIAFGPQQRAQHSIDMSWKHLIRFKGNGRTSYGDAIFPDGSDPTEVVAIATAGQLKARVIAGDPLSADATTTDEIAQVDKLLPPLERAQVPIIRCIGLNYMKHSRRSFQPSNPSALV
jgi:hypothetical protein